MSFRIKPASDVATGAQIRNKATIVFDVNPPLDTNEVVHTIDAAPPASAVLALPAEQSNARFSVSWQGDDDEGGAGIRDYSIYVRRGNEPAEIWLNDLSETTAVFEGTPGECYAFHSVARDQVGNREASPVQPDSSTCVGLDAVPPTACVGDCNGTAGVTIDEILTMLNVALGNAATSACRAGDANHDGAITINEVLLAVNSVLHGCAEEDNLEG